jgi:hypothetical protein
MKKLIPVLLLGMLGVACDDLQGTLSVQAPLALKTKKETITLNPGSQSAKFDLDEGDREIEIKVKDARGKEKKGIIKYPAGMTIPKYSGTFTVTAAQSGQSFDLSGEINTDVDEGPSIDTTESCTYTKEVERCRQVPIYNKEGKVIGHEEEWYTDTQSFTGSREVRYHNKSTTVTGRTLLTEPKNGSTLATFRGSRSWSETIYEYRGECYP